MNYEPFKLYLLNSENNISRVIHYSKQGDDYDEQLQQEGVTIESQKIKHLSKTMSSKTQNLSLFLN